MKRNPNRGANGNQGSKWIHPVKRRAIYARDEHRCLWCLKPFSQVAASLDHFIPRSMGGSNLSTNVFASCISCNSRRGDLSALEFANWLASVPTSSAYHVLQGALCDTLVRILSALEYPVERRFQRA